MNKSSFYHLLLWLAVSVVSVSAQDTVDSIREVFIPKREIGALQFIQDNPQWDGRDTVIAVFDTGVDLAALDLQTTTTGERKILDVIDASGSGDVDMFTEIELDSDEPVVGLTGRTLILPEITAEDNTIRLGIKAANTLFHRGVLNRIRSHREAAWEARLSQLRREQQVARQEGEASGDYDFEERPEAEWTFEEREKIAREELLESLRESYEADDGNFIFDCVLWFDGEHFRALIDTDADGDLAEETELRPFGIAGEYAWFDDTVASTFAIQVYEDGNTLSIVTVSGSHGTHVASIAAGHRPDQPSRNGIAPGAQVLSVKIGDIRVGGSSNTFAEMRGLAQSATYDVDLINLSWGGGSRRMDGKEFYARIFGNFMLDYNIPVLASAGNSGPALSTLGSPGGETSQVIGVGAWFSRDMAKYLYAYVDEKKDQIYSFSSTGPGKDGDLGPDIIAPGGALASVAFDQLQGQDRYHGTSMSAPSAAGVVALLASAAKAEGLETNPYLIRSALMNSAAYQDELDPWNQGAGLIQTPAAWEFLKNHAEKRPFHYHYEVEVIGNSFEDGEGIYIRSNESLLENQFFITVQPVFPDGIPPDDKVEFFEEIELRTSADWIQLPAVLPLSASGEGFTPIITDPSKPGDSETHFAWIEGVSMNFPEAGPLFRIPVTLVRGKSLSGGEDHEFDVTLGSQELVRHFFEIPANQDLLHLTLERIDEDPNETDYFIQVQSISRVGEEGRNLYPTMNPGDKEDHIIPVIPGSLTEIVFNQRRFSRNSPTTLRVIARPGGIQASPDHLILAHGQTQSDFEVISPFQDQDLDVEAELDQAVHRLTPEDSHLFIPDERSLFPPTLERNEAMNISGLQLTYSIDLEEPLKVSSGVIVGTDMSEAVSWVIFKAIHESGKILSDRIFGDFTLPAGETVFQVSIYSKNRSALEKLDSIPLELRAEMDPFSLRIFDDPRSFFLGGPTQDIALPKDETANLTFATGPQNRLHEIEPAPDFFRGSFVFEQDGLVIKNMPLHLLLGAAPEDEDEPESKIKPDDDRTPTEKYEDSLLDSRLEFARSRLSSDKADEQHLVEEILLSLIDESPDDARVLLALARFQANFSDLFIQDSDGEKEEDAEQEAGESESAEEEELDPLEPVDLETVLTHIREARSLLNEDEVALFFATSIKPEAQEEDALKAFLKLENEMKDKQSQLRESYLLEAELRLEQGQFKAFRETLAKAKKFGSPDKKLVQRLQYAALEKQDFHALAIEALNDRLEDDPFNTALWKDRIELYRKLGWDRYADRDELQMHLWKAQSEN